MVLIASIKHRLSMMLPPRLDDIQRITLYINGLRVLIYAVRVSSVDINFLPENVKRRAACFVADVRAFIFFFLFFLLFRGIYNILYKRYWRS